MEIQVKILTRETIKPSTPTPSHLKSHKLCLLDQVFPLHYVPQVLFYNNNNNNNNNTNTTYQFSTLLLPSPSNIVGRLKESLAKALSLFYPLAGRLTTDESAVDCNDKGIYFTEAQVNCSLSAFLEHPTRLDLVDQFIPKDTYDETDDLMQLIVQVTMFECGGVAVGHQQLHKIADGNSAGIFFKNWAALAAGRDKDVVTPDFDSATSLFPPAINSSQSSLARRPMPIRPLEENDRGYLVKAFAFTPQAIYALQAKARSERAPNPTRVEVLSGFIWMHAMDASARAGLSAPSVLTHLVNMRTLVDPPIPTAIGNLITLAIAYYNPQENTQAAMELPNLVAGIRKAISEVKDAKFINKLRGEGGATAIREYDKKVTQIFEDTNINKYKFACWTRLGLDVDFGFGAPVWVGSIGGRLSYPFSFIPLIATSDGGIEAWVPLDDKVMEILLSDSEFLSFASPIN